MAPFEFLRHLWGDVTFGARMLLKAPAVTVTLVGSLAFGIAANSVAFSLMNSFFIRSPPVREPERLVRIYSNLTSGFQFFTVSYPDYADVKQLSEAFSGVAADEPAAISLGISGSTERLWGSRVTMNYFSVLVSRPPMDAFLHRKKLRSPGVTRSWCSAMNFGGGGSTEAGK